MAQQKWFAFARGIKSKTKRFSNYLEATLAESIVQTVQHVIRKIKGTKKTEKKERRGERAKRLERKRKGFTLLWMKGRPCIYRFTEPVLNNAVSDVIFAIFSDTISRGKLGPHETKKESKREGESSTHLNYIDSFLFALYNQSLEYTLLFLSRSP